MKTLLYLVYVKYFILYLIFLILNLFSCKENLKDFFNKENSPTNEEIEKCPLSDGFDFPVGKPDATKYYDAQSFGVNNHLGEDWNGIKGGNSDLHDPVYAISNGVVFWSKDIGGGWGNIIRIVHKLEEDGKPKYFESLYAHLDKIYVKKGKIVKRGELIGTIGNVGGIYFAHLHLEFRNKLGMDIGGGYSSDREGFTSPTKFIKTHRPKKKSL